MWSRLNTLEVRSAGIAVYNPGAMFGPRRITDYEFVWIMEGEAVARYDDQSITAPADTILLCRKGMTDQYDWAQRRRTVHAYFHFDFELPNDWPLPATWPLAHHVPTDDILRPLFRYVLSTCQLEEPLRSTLLNPTVGLMLRAFVSGKLTTASQNPVALPASIEKVLEFIQQATLRERPPAVTLAQLASVAHVTPEHLCRLFRKHLDLGPLEAVRLARLQLAATLLSRSNMAVKEVADATGFASPYHFSRVFHQVYELSPRAFREATREGKAVRNNPIVRLLPVKA